MDKLFVEDEVISSEEFGAVFALGENFFAQGKYAKACIIFEGLMALNKNDYRPALALGESFLRTGEYDKAFERFTIILGRYENNSRALIGAAKSAMLLDKVDEAREFVLPIVNKEISAPASVTLEAGAIFRYISRL